MGNVKVVVKAGKTDDAQDGNVEIVVVIEADVADDALTGNVEVVVVAGKADEAQDGNVEIVVVIVADVADNALMGNVEVVVVTGKADDAQVAYYQTADFLIYTIWYDFFMKPGIIPVET